MAFQNTQFVRVGVGAVIIENSKVLLMRRSGSHGEGTWALPGGHQEFGESPEETAIREAEEEVGVKVVATERLGFTDDPMLDEGKHYVTLFIRCEIVNGEPRIMEPNKATDIGWFSAEELHDQLGKLFAPLRNFLALRPFATLVGED